jgi:p-hydroxybenzoate 3-monooxygenase
MRSFVMAPMRYGRLFLAGDAAHIVPPTGAKGMNLAIADVRVLAHAIAAYYVDGRTDLLAGYTDTALTRVWRYTHFSWWMTSMLHVDPDGDAFDEQLALAALRYVAWSRPMATALAENYTGLPYAEGWCYRCPIVPTRQAPIRPTIIPTTAARNCATRPVHCTSSHSGSQS